MDLTVQRRKPKLNPKRTQRLQNEWEILSQKGRKEGFSCQPQDPHFNRWRGCIFNTFEGPLHQDLLELEERFGQDHISVEIIVGSKYPLIAPIVRIVSPRLKPFTGGVGTFSPIQSLMTQVDVGGVFHSHLLTPFGWTPVATIQAILEDVKTQLVISEARLVTTGHSQYSPDETRAVQKGFYSTFKSSHPSEIGMTQNDLFGKVMLPASVLRRIVALPKVRFPLIFELSDASRTKRIHVGAIFDTDKEHIVVPEWIMSNLGSVYGDPVLVRLVKLPKGKMVRLAPADQSFHQLDDSKYILESVLRTYSALTQGQTIQFSFYDKVHEFNVLETEPGHAIDINDIDLEVDLVYLVDEEEGDPLKVPAKKEKDIGNALVPLDATQGPTKVCMHCTRAVPVDSFPRHEAFCARNNVKCPHCSHMVLKGLLQQHITDLHEKVACICGEEIEKCEMGTHKEESCTKRLVKCDYCHTKIVFSDKETHEPICGGRTDNCPHCVKPFRLKEIEAHKSQCMGPDPPTLGEQISKFFGSWSV